MVSFQYSGWYHCVWWILYTCTVIKGNAMHMLPGSVGDALGWEFQFLVLIFGNPLEAEFLFRFWFQRFRSDFFLWILLLKKWESRIRIPKFGIPKKTWCRNSIHLITLKTSIVIGYPVDLTMLNPMDAGTIFGKAIFVPIHNHSIWVDVIFAG
jgi:hypothetical protein